MTRTHVSLIALAAAAAALAAPALAQDKMKVADASFYSSDEIIVVPYGVQRYTTGRSSIGAPIETRTLSRVVDTSDLNLRYNSDVVELQRRIAFTARESCRELRRTADIPLDTQRQCVNEAVRDAQAQVESAVAVARG